MLPCLNKKFFGIECVGCGLQRSVLLLLKGDFIGAFQIYPAIYPLLLLSTFIGVNTFFKFKNDSYIRIGLIIITVLTMIVSYIIKMKTFI
ncbi:hypothetical protein AB832_02535 [Flavobacteriaceae bacterium (ex Bugula neritina AB1)]|nr:hypothetical protein AB832_02535 [Flavobacteriaceae bacterium (ex Bugula neritina AB1)]